MGKTFMIKFPFDSSSLHFMAPHLLGKFNMKSLLLCKQFCVRHVRPKDATRNNDLKSLPEPTVEEGIYQWVDGGIEIPQPPECAEQGGRNGIADEWVNDVKEEKRLPE